MTAHSTLVKNRRGMGVVKNRDRETERQTERQRQRGRDREAER